MSIPSPMPRHAAIIVVCASALVACAPSTKDYEQNTSIARQFTVSDNVGNLYPRLLQSIKRCYGKWDALGQWNVASELSSDSKQAKIYYYLDSAYTRLSIIFHVEMVQKESGTLVQIRGSNIMRDDRIAKIETSAKTGSPICGRGS